MTPAPAIYDLVLLLDPAQDDARARVLAEVAQLIATSGEPLRHDEWGTRALAYPIDHGTEAEYHLFQLHATPELLAQLNRMLRIADGVIRFRVIKLKPGTPDAPDLRPSARRAEGDAVGVGEPAA